MRLGGFSVDQRAPEYNEILRNLQLAIVPPPESEATLPDEGTLLGWCEALSGMEIPEESHMAVMGTLQALAKECTLPSVRRALTDTIYDVIC